MERKRQLRNVAFGGHWSESVPHADDLRHALDRIAAAASDCGDRDVDDEELRAAMAYVRRTLEKGAALEKAFIRALGIGHRDLRMAEAMRVSEMIRERAGAAARHRDRTVSGSGRR